MIKFDIITIFPKIFDSYFNESILKRAQKKELIKIDIHNLRNYTIDRHKTVDDKPYGGGAGMILKVEPLYKAARQISNFQFRLLRRSSHFGCEGRAISKQKRKNIRRRVILFSAKGKTMTQVDVRRWAKYEQIIMICGRYEGVDERVAKYIADEEVSVGNYVLTGGEIPAMIVVDAVSRLMPGVIKAESLIEESFSVPMRIGKKPVFAKASAGAQFSISAFGGEKIGEYPQYTRPENFRGWKVPKVLLSGDHKKIREWREGMSDKRKSQ